ncbi:MAG TPA: hypothetical protein VL157_00415 [Gemmatimonadaceae bacterium]|nr:hypothetical protein [Gemmatimonadaceae bacterium]
MTALPPGASLSKFQYTLAPDPMDDKKILALARKNAAKSIAQNKPRNKAYDATVDATRPPAPDDTGETARLFKEMKRREF